MRAAHHTKVLSDGAVRAVLKIGDLPRQGTPMKDKNGADVYDIPKGVSILSFDIATGEVGYQPIHKFTVEAKVRTVEVKTHRKSVIVSDNESLAVFDVEGEGLVKKAPEDAMGDWVPVVRRSADFGTAGDFEMGWLYGALAADGWVTGNTLGYSKCDTGLRRRVTDILRRRVHDNFQYKEYSCSKDDHVSRYGDGAEIHINSADVVSNLYRFCEPRAAGDNSKASLRKHLPEELLVHGSEECLFGLLSGLLDGDCGFSVKPRKGRKCMTYIILLHTSSDRLRDDIRLLCMKLGVRTGVTTEHNDVRHDHHSITLSAVDLWKHFENIRMFSSRSAEDVKCFRERPPENMDKSDSIPLTHEECETLRPLLYTVDDGAYSAISKPKAMTRARVLGLSEALEFACLDSLLLRAQNHDVAWEQVKSVEEAGKRDVFDVLVEGTKVFVVNSGLVIYDTASFTVPVSKKAVDQAYDLMMPGKNLLSARSGRPTYTPSNEYLQGLYYASKAPNKGQTKLFETMADAMKAYQRGDIRIDDPIRIVE